jgi:EpsI family protein
VILFGLARVMLMLNPEKMTLADALDLETEGLMTQAMRIRFLYPSAAMITAAVLMVGASLAWQAVPDRGAMTVDREPFVLFPKTLGDWQQVGSARALTADVEDALNADDYHSVYFSTGDGSPEVELFMAWYQDQTRGGVHSPEVCLPGSGWEIAWLERTDITDRIGADTHFELNRAIIQKGETRMMVFYWFQQRERRLAWDVEAKFWLMVDGIATGRKDGAMVRLTTLIDRNETDEQAEARLMGLLEELVVPLPRFVPEN